MKIFWTSIFWLLVFFLVVFYLKAFDDTMGSKVASWLSSAPIVMTGEVATGAQDPVLSGLTLVQTTLDIMTQKMETIATKLGITGTTANAIVPAMVT
ncbi:MAG: hypothetical protein WCG98_04290 [bacterium]